MTKQILNALLVVFVAALGCIACGGGSDVPEGDTCAPGETQLCLCTATEQGVQTCNENATGWGSCEGCTTAPEDTTQPPADTGSPDTTTPPDDNGQQCFTQHEKQCVGKDVYWFDSCGNQETKFESCDIGCSAGECAQGCVPKESVKCVDGQPHFFDSCGVDGGVYGAKACDDTQFCKDTIDGNPDGIFCVKPYYNGTWKLTADPKTKSACGLGDATYATLYLDLAVENGNATATATFLGEEVAYAGTVTGKQMLVSATYQEKQNSLGTEVIVDHTTTLDVTFVAPDQFEGIDADSFEADLGLGDPLACTIYWDVTGEKQ